MYVMTTSPNGEKFQAGPFASLKNAQTFVNFIVDKMTYDGEPLTYEIHVKPDPDIEILPAPTGW